jgi:hypothetical protein
MGRRRCLEHFSSDRQACEMANVIRPFLLSPSNNPKRH